LDRAEGKILECRARAGRTIFSSFTLWKLRGAIAAKGELAGFHDSVLIDPFFLFFATLFLAATALVILLSVKYLEVEKEQEGEILRAPAVCLRRHDVHRLPA